VLLGKNPLQDLRITNNVYYVVKNGEVFDADTLDEVWPKEAKAAPFSWQTPKPEGLPGIEK